MVATTKTGNGFRLFKATYKDRQGRTRDSQKWYCEFRDHLETRRRIPTFSHRSAADEFGRHLAKLVAYHKASGGQTDPALVDWLDTLPKAIRQKLINIGLLDGRRDMVGRTLSEHLGDYQDKLTAGGRTAKHIATQKKYIRAMADDAKWNFVSEITADDVNAYTAALREDGRAGQTVRNHLSAIKAFTSWLHRTYKLNIDPLLSVHKPNARAERQWDRRYLLHDEWHWLRASAEQASACRNVSGQERALLYATAIQTGLRSSELRCLTRGRLFLSVDPPYITVPARSTKNRKDARQYVAQDLAVALARHVRAKAPKAPVFDMPSPYDVADMLRDDLAAARQAWLGAAKHDPEEQRRRQESDFLLATNHDGQRLDFHALRHTCGAWVAMTGAHPKAIQAVMRHSSITLTMDTYGHLFPGQEADTIARLPEMLTRAPEVHQATGTDDATANDDDSVLVLCLAKKDGLDRTDVDQSGRSGSPQDGVPRDGKLLLEHEKRPSKGRIDPKPPVGLEPTTCGLQNRCSTN